MRTIRFSSPLTMLVVSIAASSLYATACGGDEKPSPTGGAGGVEAGAGSGGGGAAGSGGIVASGGGGAAGSGGIVASGGGGAAGDVGGTDGGGAPGCGGAGGSACGCQAGAGGVAGDCGVGGAPPTSSPFRATTFNTGLSPYSEPAVAERAPEVISALVTDAAMAAQTNPAELQALCVQEFWLDATWQGLIGAADTASVLPHRIRLAAIPGVGQCSTGELTTLGTCIATNSCSGSSEQVMACAQTNCAAEIVALSGVCAPCVVDAVATGVAMDQLGTVCINDPAGQREPAIYGGVFDIGLLTNATVLEQDSVELDSYFVRAAAIYARLDDPNVDEDIHVFCTHLGSALEPLFPYKGAHTDWETEQNQQITQLLAFIDSKQISGKVVLMGDLNNGPDQAPLVGEWPGNYARQLAEGSLTNPYTSQSDVACTLCPDNSWRASDSDPKLIDHFLLSGFASGPTVERIFDATRTIPDLAEPAHLSDHYGLRLVVPAQ